MPLYEMRKFVAPELIFGAGSRHRAGYYALNLQARRLLIVSDPGVIQAGWLDDLMPTLEEAGLETRVFSGVTPNPRDHEIMAGVALYRHEGCDVILAIGGGSVIDCAKGIGVVVGNGGQVLDYAGVDRISLPGPPLICIPTTAGTAADISQFAIVNDVGRRCKTAIVSKTVVPDIALVDPEVTLTMDPYLTACAGLDALTHAIEAYVSTASSPVVDIHALAAIELVRDNIKTAVAEPADLAARENRCWPACRRAWPSRTPASAPCMPWRIAWAAIWILPMARATRSCSIMSSASTSASPKPATSRWRAPWACRRTGRRRRSGKSASWARFRSCAGPVVSRPVWRRAA
ncbi:iron-containing alcohol dehydrogenase [Thiorhodococcus minor]|uniref:iron-containing alcohol dehydrogenase n=1 Tax=Thiorhodococcus minor TaxID=57489 RepID=UPI003CC91982